MCWVFKSFNVPMCVGVLFFLDYKLQKTITRQLGKSDGVQDHKVSEDCHRIIAPWLLHGERWNGCSARKPVYTLHGVMDQRTGSSSIRIVLSFSSCASGSWHCWQEFSLNKLVIIIWSLHYPLCDSATMYELIYHCSLVEPLWLETWCLISRNMSPFLASILVDPSVRMLPKQIFGNCHFSVDSARSSLGLHSIAQHKEYHKLSECHSLATEDGNTLLVCGPACPIVSGRCQCKNLPGPRTFWTHKKGKCCTNSAYRI